MKKRLDYINWNDYFMAISLLSAKRSKDPVTQVGACIVDMDNKIVSIGYNGFPSGVEEDWTDRDERRKYVNHSEQNALRFVKPNECYLAAVTLLPCNDCLKSLASYGIKKVIYREVYDRDDSSLIMANKFGIELKQLDYPIKIS